MKKLILCAFLALSSITMHGQGIEMYEFEQYSFISNLCFTETSTQKIRTNTQLDLETLTFPDKLKFKRKEYVREQRQYIDDSGDFSSEASFVSHSNMFPKWYSHPTRIKTSKTGIYSYFNTNSQYLHGGWEGGHFDQKNHGEYVSNSRTRENYYVKQHTSKSYQQFAEVNNRVQSYGVLYKYVWRYPKTTFLRSAQSEGYTVTKSSNEITIESTSIRFVWNLVKKTYTRTYLENGVTVRTVHTTFMYSENIGNHLIHNEITIVPANFENGDCYEVINTTTYTDYNIDCSEGIGLRSSVKSIDSNINVYPNPTTGILNVDLDCNDCDKQVKYSITNTVGETMIMRKENAFSGQIDLNGLPIGIYFLNISSASNDYSIKFVKN